MITTNATRCVGKIRTSHGNWYSPAGTESSKTTYCEYCFKEGCLTGCDFVLNTFRNCDCDCPHQENHPRLFSFLCHLCRVENPYTTTTYGSGNCVSCGKTTYGTNLTYCDGCSAFLGGCRCCGEPIKSGNDCVEDIHRWTEGEIAQRRACMMVIDKDIANPLLEPSSIELLVAEGKEYEEDISRLLLLVSQEEELYANKSCEEVIAILADK